MNVYRLLFVLFILGTSFLWASVPPVQLLSERNQTAWNFVDYRLLLTNLSNSTLENPTIRYFAENPRIQYCKSNPNEPSCAGWQYGDFDIDSSLRAYVDTYTYAVFVFPQLSYDSRYSIVSFKVFGSVPANATMAIAFRLIKNDGSTWDCSYDFSFQPNAAVQEENYKMAVYDEDGNLLWGYDPVAVKRDSANIYWHDRAGTAVIPPYDGGDSAKVFDGRFWLLKGSPLTFEERNALSRMGANLLETTRYQGKGLHLLRADIPIQKNRLASDLSDFYNAFDVDDTTSLSRTLSSGDLYEETQVCDENDSCTTVVTERFTLDMVVECWPDLPMNLCKSVVLNCGGDSAYIDRSVVLANLHRDSVQCLEKSKDVRKVQVQREGGDENDASRQAINIASLQNDSNWQQAMLDTTDTLVSMDWLKGADYTGEGIIVGVYDSGIDYTHPGFLERDSSGNAHVRITAINEKWRDEELKKIREHGTHVAGIIGGSGSMSKTAVSCSTSYCGPYQYRGVAPKVKFYSGPQNFYNQRGHVANHSHFLLEDSVFKEGRGLSMYLFYYGDMNRELDNNIFFNWKAFSENGDNITKTVVTSMGNYGTDNARNAKGYFSVTKQSKNAIVVGSYNSSDSSLSGVSSLGPTWDGRIKPDIMAPGVGVWSAYPHYKIWEKKHHYYLDKGGTSMATAFVSGVAALMYQKFQKTVGLPLDVYSMRNSTIKALLIHTAIDMQKNYCNPHDSLNPDIVVADSGELRCTPYAPGPDFATGWGRMDAGAALSLIDGYDAGRGTFDKFREFYIYNGVQKRWTINVPASKKHLRVSLVWDDAAGHTDINDYMEKKLVNDLDLYLISPSGKIYYPWQLDRLPTQNLNNNGQKAEKEGYLDREYGLEKITYADASDSASNCSSLDTSVTPVDSCFDRLNNVEVVDVDENKMEAGVWQVVVRGHRVETGNSPDKMAQIASIVSDLTLNEPTDNGQHPYAANVQTSEMKDLGNGFLEHYVTFGSETSLGAGDHIYLYDGWNRLLGDYTGISLANQRILVTTRFLKIVLDSDNDNSQGWGYSISKVEHVPYGVLQVLFPPYKKED